MERRNSALDQTVKCQFINILQTDFLYQSALRSFSLITVCLRDFWPKNIGTKTALKMLVKLTTGVDFINILRVLFCRYPLAKKSQSQTVIREKLCKALWYEKICS
jgi:hypothetical protein